MKSLTMMRKLLAKAVSILLLGGLLFSNLALNVSFGTQTHAAGIRIEGVSYWDKFVEYSWLENVDKTENNTDVYHIKTAEELAGFAKLVNEGNSFEGKIITLDNDINIGDHYWVPIGCYKNKPFKGVFDGSGCTVYNVKVIYDERFLTFDAYTFNWDFHSRPKGIDFFASMITAGISGNIKNITTNCNGKFFTISNVNGACSFSHNRFKGGE